MLGLRGSYHSHRCVVGLTIQYGYRYRLGRISTKTGTSKRGKWRGRMADSNVKPPWLLPLSLSRCVTSPCPGYACRPNRAMDGRGLSPPPMRSLVGCFPHDPGFSGGGDWRTSHLRLPPPRPHRPLHAFGRSWYRPLYPLSTALGTTGERYRWCTPRLLFSPKMDKVELITPGYWAVVSLSHWSMECQG